MPHSTRDEETPHSGGSSLSPQDVMDVPTPEISLEEAQHALEELRVVEEELRAQNDELSNSRAELAAERQRYRDLFELAPDAYFVTDVRGVIQEANQAALDLFELPASS